MQCTCGNIALIWYNTFYNKRPVTTGLDQFFCVVDRLGLVFKGLVVVPEYLNQSRPVAVASCLILGEKNQT